VSGASDELPPVDPDLFLQALPSLWADFPRSEVPRDPRFRDVADRVPGLTRPNNLALLNLAASHLAADELYVEIGSFRGTSLIAAMLGNEGKQFVAIDDFSMRDASLAQLESNLRKFDLSPAKILEGDAFAILRSDALDCGQIGVYYYDAAHTYEQQLEGLRLAEPYLAQRALLIVDDTDWDFVAQATRDYLKTEERARLLVEIHGKGAGQPAWWEGVQVLAWDSALGDPG
jgi:predicted O-methyltransferase YrrM